MGLGNEPERGIPGDGDRQAGSKKRTPRVTGREPARLPRGKHHRQRKGIIAMPAARGSNP